MVSLMLDGSDIACADPRDKGGDFGSKLWMWMPSTTRFGGRAHTETTFVRSVIIGKITDRSALRSACCLRQTTAAGEVTLDPPRILATLTLLCVCVVMGNGTCIESVVCPGLVDVRKFRGFGFLVDRRNDMERVTGVKWDVSVTVGWGRDGSEEVVGFE